MDRERDGHLGGWGPLNTGGRYDPAIDTWTTTSTGTGVPEARTSPTAVWTGGEMIVWGGLNAHGSQRNSGGRYDPLTDAWTPTSTGANAPAKRYRHTAVWTGSEMIVWGGRPQGAGNLTLTGGLYCSCPRRPGKLPPMATASAMRPCPPAAPRPHVRHSRHLLE